MSKFIEWSSELSVGIEEIDAQHQVLVDLLNQIHEAIQQRHAAEVTQSIIEKLGEYTRIHFAVEESLMRILHYPDYESHKSAHDKLIEQLLDLQGRLNTGKAVSFELAHFLKVWLTKHTMESDQRYAPYFLEQGIKPNLSKQSWAKKLWGSLSRG